MKRYELVFREILYRVIEGNEHRFTQSELSKKLGISLSIVNSAVKRFETIGAVKVSQRSFRIIELKKAIYYWASVRNLAKDIVFSANVKMPVRELERNMPSGAIFTAYSAYKLRFNDVPADYSEVYAYANEKEIGEIKKRFKTAIIGAGAHNLFVLKKDELLGIYENIPLIQVFADLWNLKEWYASEFVNTLEKRILESKK